MEGDGCADDDRDSIVSKISDWNVLIMWSTCRTASLTKPWSAFCVRRFESSMADMILFSNSSDDRAGIVLV